MAVCEPKLSVREHIGVLATCASRAQVEPLDMFAIGVCMFILHCRNPPWKPLGGNLVRSADVRCSCQGLQLPAELSSLSI